MRKRYRKRRPGGLVVVLAVGVLLLLGQPGFAQDVRDRGRDAAENPPAARAPEATATTVDLRTLVERARRAAPQAGEAASESVLTITGKRDGTVEVRNRAGEVMEVFEADAFPRVGQVSPEARQRISARQAAMAEELAERKEADRAEAERQRKAAEAAAAREKKQAEAREARWQEQFASEADSYRMRQLRASERVKAVKINAKEIRDDGTILYEGKQLKPVRLWSNQRMRYEMAIPVEEAKESSNS